jgi:hypothetical protein
LYSLRLVGSLINFNIFSSIEVRDQVSRPYKTTGKLKFIFLLNVGLPLASAYQAASPPFRTILVHAANAILFSMFYHVLIFKTKVAVAKIGFNFVHFIT